MSLFKLNGIIGKLPSTLPGEISAQLKNVNLKAVKSISASYDPFGEEIESTRRFVFEVCRPKVLKTNPDCKIQTKISCDRSEPTIAFQLITGNTVLFKGSNLTVLEMLQLYNKHITPHAPAEEQARETLVTKAMRKSKN